MSRPGSWHGSCDLVVVGGGTAGLVAAQTASSLGARVLLIERAKTGGDCLWTGCVPSKALLAVASAAAQARSAPRLGVDVDAVRIDFARARQHVGSAIAAIAPADAPEALEAAGVRVLHGEATLIGPARLAVDGRTIAAVHVLLATGAAPTVPDLPGLRAARPLTSETIWALEELPRQLVVLGGGPVGCELGQAFARLGSTVTIVERGEHVLGREDPWAAALVTKALRADGVQVRTGVQAQSVTPARAGATGSVLLDDGTTAPFSHLLVALGRTPRTEGIGLEAAGVAVDAGGHVVVDAHLRTTNPRIWAAGDLTGHPQFTHTAGTHGSLAARNAVLGLRGRVDRATEPRVTFTAPEVAAVGAATGPADAVGGLTVRTVPHEGVDRAVAEADTAGFTRLVRDGKGRVVGATVVGPRAGETIGELTLAVRHRLRIRHLATTTHAYPTYNDAVWNAAIADVRASLAKPLPAAALRGGVALRRRWLRAQRDR